MEVRMHKPPAPTFLPLRQYLQLLKKRICSSYTRRRAALRFRHPPTRSECALFFLESGGLQRFHRKYNIQPGK